jgi:catechol 2,3-dioxygenase-like lactoylglutathione lyase family enzyme
MGDGRQLHLIAGDTKGMVMKKGVHLALAVSDFDGFLKFLDGKGVSYSDWPGEKHATNVRADGVRQIYLQDPDGYWIEINDVRQN